jgi:diguanylate cyclase (GGDEF)-like protein
LPRQETEAPATEPPPEPSLSRTPAPPKPRPPHEQVVAAAPALHLERALQLLGHSGQALPDAPQGSEAWLQGLVDALVELSSRDALTGLANRRAFDLALAREIDRVARSGEPALLLALDIDHFKRVNDTWGHAAGDLVLRAVASALIDSVRPMDLVARIGGEEFAIILPNCAAAFGETVAERVRRRVERMPVAVAPGQQISCTVSIGGAFAPQWVRSTAALWTERADQQLYRAKAQGRNLVRLEPTAVSVVSSEERRLLFETFQIQDHE